MTALGGIRGLAERQLTGHAACACEACHASREIAAICDALAGALAKEESGLVLLGSGH
jgi:hypothetical protein